MNQFLIDLITKHPWLFGLTLLTVSLFLAIGAGMGDYGLDEEDSYEDSNFI